jgi:hypothetical protein
MAEKTKHQKMDEVLGRALRDSEFRQRLTSNPKAIAAEVGLSSEELEVIAGGVQVGGNASVMYCTAKTCNEKGGTRVPY